MVEIAKKITNVIKVKPSDLKAVPGKAQDWVRRFRNKDDDDRAERSSRPLHPIVKPLLFIGAFYLFLFGYSYFGAERTVQKLQDSMPSEITAVKRQSTFGLNTNHNAAASKNTQIIEGLSRLEDDGQLPVIRPNDLLTSFRAYQTPFQFKNIGSQAVLSFMMVDYGLSEQNSVEALQIMPAEVSFLLSPYAKQPKEWIKQARAKGHEVWMEMPIQVQNSSDQGLNTIYHHSSFPEKRTAMRKTLDRALGYVGVGLYADETLLSTKDHYSKLTNEFYGRGLGVFVRNADSPDFIEGIALARGAPFIKADMEVQQLKGNYSIEKLEMLAKDKGNAIALIYPYAEPMQTISEWIKQIGSVDYIIAPISSMHDLPLVRSAGNQEIPSHLSAQDYEGP